jgi:small subunit ribosomal protein S9
VAQVKLYPEGKGEITVNGKDIKEYLPVYALQEAVMSPLATVGLEKVKVEAKVSGGGVRGQAEAIRLGLSRALLLINADWRASLKKQGFLTRDPREKERKKPGLKKARRAPQWSKR